MSMTLSLKMKTAGLTVAGATCLALSTAAPSLAGSLSYSGTTVGQPTWNRPLSGNPPTSLSGVGTATRYSVFEFFVDTSGAYNFLSVATNPANWDNYTFLYQNSFNPLAPLTNVLRGNDDFPDVGQSGFNGVSLTAGVNYFLVTTGFGNTSTGAFTNTITGPGNIAAVPTPALLPGLIGMGVAALRKRKSGAAEEAS